MFTEDDKEIARAVLRRHNVEVCGIDPLLLGVVAKDFSEAGVCENGKPIHPSFAAAKRLLNELGYKL